ncbi:MAG: hypothetical protein GPJ51_01860 [Candidatus Heimdallarchaeota archaeon]|nr:hypothetical protein [Candidatus Heimdallarchaeota archaeon]
MKEKKIIIAVMIAALLFYLIPSASAITVEENTGVDSPGLFTYSQRFADLSGSLSIATTAVNDSGMKHTYVIVSAICMDENRNFLLRIYDSDEDLFIEPNNEASIGEKFRKFTVSTHPDQTSLLWTAYITDLDAVVIYAQLSLFYFYDEGAEFVPPGEEDGEEGMSPEEVKTLLLQTNLSYIATIAITVLLTGAFVIQREGTGVKSFFKNKLKGEQK